MKTCDICKEKLNSYLDDEENYFILNGYDVCSGCLIKISNIIQEKPEIISKYKLVK